MQKIVCIPVLLLLLMTAVQAQQKDVIDLLKKTFKADHSTIDSTRLKKKFQFSLIPVAGSAAGGGKAVATAFNASFYTGDNFVYWHPAAGAGLRIKFNKISRTNIGIDVGVSKDFTGVYLSLGEAF